MAMSGFFDDTCALLERTPVATRQLLDGLPESWLGEPDVAGGWTARDVVGHLISAEIGLNVPRLTSSFSYSIPEPLSGRVKLGPPLSPL